MFRAADPFFISFLDLLREEFIYDDTAAEVFKNYAKDKLTPFSNSYRQKLKSNFITIAASIGENWTSGSYCLMNTGEFQNFSTKGLLNCYGFLNFLSYTEWLRFWFVTLHPLMPWSYIWDSSDMSCSNSFYYKTYIRTSAYYLVKAILGQDLDNNGRMLASSILGHLTATVFESTV